MEAQFCNLISTLSLLPLPFLSIGDAQLTIPQRSLIIVLAVLIYLNQIFTKKEKLRNNFQPLKTATFKGV